MSFIDGSLPIAGCGGLPYGEAGSLPPKVQIAYDHLDRTCTDETLSQLVDVEFSRVQGLVRLILELLPEGEARTTLSKGFQKGAYSLCTSPRDVQATSLLVRDIAIRVLSSQSTPFLEDLTLNVNYHATPLPIGFQTLASILLDERHFNEAASDEQRCLGFDDLITLNELERALPLAGRFEGVEFRDIAYKKLCTSYVNQGNIQRAQELLPSIESPLARRLAQLLITASLP